MSAENSLHVVCPGCQGVNRVQSGRLNQGPACGTCHAPLLPGTPLPLGREAFHRHLNRSDLPLVVKFWAPWCGPCRASAPAFAQAAKSLAPAVVAATVNTEDEQVLARELNIQAVPTMILFQGGREKARQPGAMDARGVEAWVRGNL